MAKKSKMTTEEKIAHVMREFDRGALSSSSGKRVTDKKQALAIGYSEAKKRGLKK